MDSKRVGRQPYSLFFSHKKSSHLFRGCKKGEVKQLNKKHIHKEQLCIVTLYKKHLLYNDKHEKTGGKTPPEEGQTQPLFTALSIAQ